MTAPPRKNAPNAERPAMTVQARGPLTAAQRTVDAGSLVAWATQRAIDVETKRLEEVERERRRVESIIEQRKQSEAAKQPDNKQPDGAHPSDTAPGAGNAAQTGAPSSAQGSAAAPGSAAGFERRLRPGSGPVLLQGP
jgi:hypothetical protein